MVKPVDARRRGTHGSNLSVEASFQRAHTEYRCDDGDITANIMRPGAQPDTGQRLLPVITS